MRLEQSKIKIRTLVQFKLAQKRGLQFYQTRSLPAVCIAKAVCMKTKEEFFHKVHLSPRLPRVVLEANWHSGQQDQQEQDARTSCDQASTEHPTYPFLQSNSRTLIAKTKVKRLIQQFESHLNKESFLQDFNQTEKINKISKKSEKLIADTNNTEIFELCETSSKKTMPRL